MAEKKYKGLDNILKEFLRRFKTSEISPLKEDIQNIEDNMVNLSETQTLTGRKIFSNGLSVSTGKNLAMGKAVVTYNSSTESIDISFEG